MQNVMELNVNNCAKLSSLSFKFISCLRNLTVLKACYLSNYQFDVNIKSCLLEVGNKLTILDLSGITNVDTHIIGSCCPDLKELSLNDCVFMQPVSDMDKSLVQSCDQLKILSMTQMNFVYSRYSITSIRSIFTGQNCITHLTLTSSTEPFLKTLIREFEFLELVSLNLSGSTSVTLKLILTMLQLFPKLSELTVRKCNLIKSEKRVLKDFIDKANIDLKLNID